MKKTLTVQIVATEIAGLVIEKSRKEGIGRESHEYIGTNIVKEI
jgi:hypothetical protein